MANPLVKYVKPKITNDIPISSPGETTNPLEKYMTSTTKSTVTQQNTEALKSTNPLEKYMNNQQTDINVTGQQQTQQQKYDIMNPVGMEKMMNIPDEPFKMSTLGKRILRDLAISVPMIGAGLIQWPVQAHRQTISGDVGKYGVFNTGKMIAPKEYSQPSGIGYIPTMLYNMIFRPGVDTITQMSSLKGNKELLKSYYQHPILGPLGTGVSLALPLMAAKSVIPKATAYPQAVKAGFYSPKAAPEPTFAQKVIKKAVDKFNASPKAMRFKELTGLLPEQRDYFNLRYAYELERSDMMSKAGRSELYQTLQKFTPAEKESFIINLEMAKPSTPESMALLKKAKITISEPTVNVAKALDLWKASSEEGLAYMMDATGKTLYKGGAQGKLLTKAALARGKAEFKVPLLKEAKEFRAEVKKLGGISEESAKPYMDIIPKDLIKKNGIPLGEVVNKLKMPVEEVILKLRKYSEMQKEFTNLAVDKMTKKFGYKVPIGTEPGKIRGSFIEEARWQPTIQALEAKLGAKFTIQELKDLGFKDPDYFHHTFPRDYQFRTRAYTGPTYSPGIWKERMGAQGYSRDPLTSIKDYDYQLIKYKALNQFKDFVFDKFGQRLNPENPMQAAEIRKSNLVKYGKGKVLYETPEGMTIKIKDNVTLPRTVANEFNKMFADTSRGEMFFRTYFDPVTNAWKVPVLALSPRWVFNNIAGNFILNTLGGVGPGGYMDAIGSTFKAAKLMAEAKKAGSPITYMEALTKLGIPERVAQGIYHGEGMITNEGLPITKMQKTAAGVKYIPNKVYKFNSAIESFYRTAHYLDKVGKEFTREQAIASVNEFLFDYSNSSPLQKSVLRRLDPFISWHKNIIRLAVSYPIKHTNRFLLLSYANKIGTEAYDDKLRKAGVDPENIPDYYKQMYLLPWKDKDGKDFYISLRGIDPLADITDIGVSSLHPALKIILERHFKENSYSQKSFSSPYTVYGEKSEAVPPLWRHILNQFPQFRVIEDVARPYSIYDTGEPMVTKWGEPVYTKNRLLSVLSIFGFKVTARDIEDIYRKSIEDERSKDKREQKYNQSLEMFKQNQK